MQKKNLALIFATIILNINNLKAMDNNEFFSINKNDYDKIYNENINIKINNIIQHCNKNIQNSNININNNINHNLSNYDDSDDLVYETHCINNYININSNRKSKYSLNEYIQYIRQYVPSGLIDISKIKRFIGKYNAKYPISTWRKCISGEYKITKINGEKYKVKTLRLTKDGFSLFNFLSMPLKTIPEEKNMSDIACGSSKSISTCSSEKPHENHNETKNDRKHNTEKLKNKIDVVKEWYEELNQDSINKFKERILNKDIENKFIKLLFDITDKEVKYSENFLLLLQNYSTYDIKYLNDIKDILAQKSIQTVLNDSFKYNKIENLKEIEFLNNKEYNENYKSICNIVSLTLFEFQSFQEIHDAIFYQEKYENEIQEAVDNFTNLINNQLYI